jgi:hypothetical protein
MDNRKITDKRFESGTFRKVLKKEMRAADLSVAGRARVDAALKAALEREKKVGGLRYGISSKRLRNSLRPKDMRAGLTQS